MALLGTCFFLRSLHSSSKYETALALDPDEVKIAQLLTRDAWSYFASPTELANRAPVRTIPGMPRNGTFTLPKDPQIISYYLAFADTYMHELSSMGWAPRRFHDVCDSFLGKVECATGLHRRTPERESGMRATS